MYYRKNLHKRDSRLPIFLFFETPDIYCIYEYVLRLFIENEIIRGKELEKIFDDTELLNLFFELSINCLSVVCSRVSPKQKGQLVNLIKNTEKAITLAIGDGANDVNMITTANIGIGIMGVEGLQAARASDYCISEFQFLKRLLFVHGRESYRKNSFIVCYNFYKNFLFVMPLFYVGFYSFFSGQTIYDPWLYQLYNLSFTVFSPSHNMASFICIYRIGMY